MSQTAAPSLPRRRWQFSLRTFLLFVLVVAVPLAWAGTYLQRFREQHRALYQLRSKFAQMTLEVEPGLVPGEFFQRVVGVYGFLKDAPITLHDIDLITRLPFVEELDLSHTNIDDEGLTHLRRMKNLRMLHLSGTQVTDEGVRTLHEALPNLEILDD